MLDLETLNATCKTCGKDVNEYDLFSNGNCIDCHKKTFKMPKNGQEVKKAFIKSINI